jgi:hypothetical protein
MLEFVQYVLGLMGGLGFSPMHIICKLCSDVYHLPKHLNYSKNCSTVGRFWFKIIHCEV